MLGAYFLKIGGVGVVRNNFHTQADSRVGSGRSATNEPLTTLRLVTIAEGPIQAVSLQRSNSSLA